MSLALEPVTIDNVSWTPVQLPVAMNTIEAQVRTSIDVTIGPFSVDVKGRVNTSDATREFIILSLNEFLLSGRFPAGQPICYLQSVSGTHTVTNRFTF